jgi:hypothetical protein
VIDVADTTTGSTPSSDPNRTVAPDTNPEPDTVTRSPPTVEPDDGDTPDTTGLGATYVKSSAVTSGPPGVAVDPADVVTTTSTFPGVTVAGVRTVTDVDDTTDTDRPSTPPKNTFAPEMNPAPVTVTNVFPAVEPDTGDTDTNDGATAV